jgi:hypothetical protein
VLSDIDRRIRSWRRVNLCRACARIVGRALIFIGGALLIYALIVFTLIL